ncbi:AsmA family protein [Roseococcus sp.]|uniref:AsmA family protein n=1 Tax=Roseococcus sp. TaxID=2109646 RepID=UPI003BAC298F
MAPETEIAEAEVPKPAKGLRRRTVVILSVIGGVIALVPVALVAAWFLLPTLELAPYVVGRAVSATGRSVAIGSLRVTPGRWLRVAVEGARLGNIEGGSRPEMLTLTSASVEVELIPLVLRREIVLRHARADGFSLLLERTADRQRNWRFKETPPQRPSVSAPDPQSRRGFPWIQDLAITGSEIIVRTGSGQALRTGLDEVSLTAEATDQPVQLRIDGAYNTAALRLEGRLGTYQELWDFEKPFPIDLHLTTGDTVLTLRGTATDPLNFDGIHGQLALHAPTPDALLAIAGVTEGGPHLSFEMEGLFERQGELWRLSTLKGAIQQAAFTGPLLQIAEGSEGSPDRVTAHLDFTRLDLNRLLGSRPREGSAPSNDADLPLVVQAHPDPLIEARLTATELHYGDLRATEARIQAAMVEDRIVVDDLSMRAFGSRIQAKGQLERRGDDVAVLAQAALREGNLETLRRAFGIRSLPLTGGRLEARVIVQGRGRSLNAAARNASIGAVVAMNGGQIQREVIEMASTDLRSLFRTPRGMTPVACLLAVAEIRAGAGEVAPLRIQAGTGTIAGIATFDLNRRQLDLVIGSQRDTTSFFALDIPIRASGSFASPTIRPARWSPEGRARLAAGDTVAAVPAELRDFARGNLCYRAGANSIRPTTAPPRAQASHNNARQPATQTRQNMRR